MEYIDDCVEDAILYLNVERRILNSEIDDADDLRIMRINCIYIMVDTFHQEIHSRDEYIDWCCKHFMRRLNKLTLDQIDQMDTISEENFLSLYLNMAQMEYEGKVTMKCLKNDCEQNKDLYSETFLKVVDCADLFRYISNFID